MTIPQIGKQKATSIYKFFGAAGITGGLLKVAVPLLVEPLSSDATELLYSIIDLSLILNLIGFYIVSVEKVRAVGTVGFISMISGLSFIAGPETTLYSRSAYEIGKPIIGIGILLASFDLLPNQSSAAAGLGSLLLSVGLGLAAMLGVQPLIFGHLSGLLFGIGFILIGAYVYHTANGAFIQQRKKRYVVNP